MIWLLPFFLCWGSFLNVLGYRIVRGQSIILPRSCCPYCRHQLAWYDLIPVISWIVLKGGCRYCHVSISWLYPFIEIFTAGSMMLLIEKVSLMYVPAYFIFFSALIVTIRSDIETMLISRFVTLFLVPIAFLLSLIHLLPINFSESLGGFLFGYGILYAMKYLVLKATGKDGIGQGDVELLALIGAFTGILGCWIALFIGSITGSCAGIMYMACKGFKRETKIPFGPFLAIGALLFVIYSYELRIAFFHIFLP